MIAVERNQQHPDPVVAHTIVVRSLKGRFNGRTGIVGALRFNREIGRLESVEYHLDEEGTVTFKPECAEDVFGETP